MMKMNVGAWIGIIGAIIGILVAIIVVIITASSMGIYIAIGIMVLFGGMFLLFYKLFFGPMINAARLRKTGLPGKARILQVSDTGVTVNNSPLVKLTLEIKNSFGQKYTAYCRVLVPRLNPGAYAPGMELPVKIDPKNEQNVVPDFSGENSGFFAPIQQEEQLKAELEKLNEEQNSFSLSGRRARAIIKKYNWLGAYVNGENPYVELELEVLPENMTAFSGKARGVISKSSVHKYQPGSEIYVKYDLYDNSKIIIDGST
jgi:hypothetical protein